MAGNLAQLQNGSDIRGVAIASEGRPATLTGEAAGRIAAAFVGWLSRRTKKAAGALRIGLGHDPRISAPVLKAHALGGIAAAGAIPFDCALCSTPAMFMSTVYPETAFDGAVMLTASHLPSDRNGMKCFTRDGGLDKADIAQILADAERLSPPEILLAAPKRVDLLGLYTADLREKISAGVGASPGELPLSGLHVAVDAGNGAGGFFVDRVLAPLGADTSGSIFLEPDGLFPNHPPNPEHRAAMAALRAAVLECGADLGLVFDTDVDRMAAVLADGSEVGSETLIATVAAIIAPDCPGGTVVTDSVTSERLTAFLEGELGLRHRRFVRGYKNVINEALRLNREGVPAPLAIETSGHGALMENYFLDDGAYLAVRLLIAAAIARRNGASLGALTARMRRCFESREIRVPVTAADCSAAGTAALEAFRLAAEKRGIRPAESCEGVRLTFDGGWLLLRMSLHDPLLPLFVEGNGPGDCDRLLAVAAGLLSEARGLDLSVLRPAAR